MKGLRSKKASMRPRPVGLGNEHTWAAPGIAGRSFNEAEARGPRKCREKAGTRSFAQSFNEAEARGPRKWEILAEYSGDKKIASMRPRPVGLGNDAARRALLVVSAKLQ